MFVKAMRWILLTAIITGIWQPSLSQGESENHVNIPSQVSESLASYTVGEGYIHFNISDHEPKRYGGKRMTWVKSETIFFRFVGPNRMMCHDRITGGSWEAVRIR